MLADVTNLIDYAAQRTVAFRRSLRRGSGKRWLMRRIILDVFKTGCAEQGMQVRLQRGRVIFVAESDSEGADLIAWKELHSGHAFVLTSDQGKGACLASLGPRAGACREPINVHSNSPDPQIALIANFAPTPFTLDGIRYACVEAFWQSLRFSPEKRMLIAAMDGKAAKRASDTQPYGTHVHYAGEDIPVGTFAHWQLMRRACIAKFEQNSNARNALLATGDRPLVHHVRQDSKTIPGVVMADIWMKLRAQFRGAEER